MKKKLIFFLLPVLSCCVLAGCTEAERASYNLSKQADNFNDIRQITVINCLQGDVLFQMTGKMSITADVEDNQLEVIVQDENGEYKKHFIGLSDNVTYVVEDIQAMPTIDPESLRPRGTWEGTADGYADGELAYDTWTCSECGYTVETDDPDDLTKFCPYCGAKMEGGHNP